MTHSPYRSSSSAPDPDVRRHAGQSIATNGPPLTPVPPSVAQRAASITDDYALNTALWLLPFIAAVGMYLTTSDALTLIEGWGGTKATWRTVGLSLTAVAFVLYLLTAWGAIRRGQRVSVLEANIAILQAQVEALEEQRLGLEAQLGAMSDNFFSIIDDLLKALAGQLGFGQRPSNSERITIYAHDRRGYFTTAGRFSENPDLGAKGRRVQYAVDQGCIAKAWRDGWYFRHDYPNPETDQDAWVLRCRQDGILESTARGIRMKSRLYCGYRVDSAAREPLAVVIVESLDSERYNEQALRDFFGKNGGMLQAAITRVNQVLPRAANAREAGF